ncbi:AraC family transcriptional regulator [Rhizobium sp. 2MFCol3.1]|uniref:AraC family transcriptional regulator n=1 Tax=Rhizobium sp. 2MFCol3.1 TaxID=1246459 RepID=UPI0018CB7ABD|nr:AraC family transcriptional regulator [Rhizobium sp. 2MFCol3.1]
MLRAQIIHPYLEALRSKNMRLKPLLKDLSLYEDTIESPMERVPIADFLQFTHRVSEATKEPLLGFKLGARRYDSRGPLSTMVFFYARSLHQALELFCEFADAFQERTLFKLTRNHKTSQVAYRIVEASPELARHDVEFTMTALYCMIRQFLGPFWSALHINFEHGAPPASKAAYERFYRAPVSFNQPINEIVLKESDLVAVNPLSDETAIELLRDHIRTVRSEMARSSDLTHRVSLAVTKLIGTENCDLPTVAGYLNMSTRSLQRRLSEEKTSFVTILQKQRFRIAQSLMRDRSRRSMATIAEMVGYADEASLSRAFKSWAGQSPRSYKRQIHREALDPDELSSN